MSQEICSLDIRPVTPGQEAIWLMTHMSADRNLYNVHFVWDIPHSVDLTLLKKSLEYLKEHHDAWRTTYEFIDGVVYRKVHQHAELNYTVERLESDDDSLLSERLDRDFLQAYDLKNEVPLKWKVYLRPNKSPVLAWYQHHICIDLWSAVLIVNQLKTLYGLALRGESLQLLPVEKNFDDFIQEQQVFLDSERGQKQREFGLKTLDGFCPTAKLPYEYNQSGQFVQQSGYFPFELDADDVGLFNRICRKNKVMQFNGFLALFHLLLYRLSGDTDMAICTPTAGRDSRYRGVCNYFVNPVLVRLKYDGNINFTSFLGEANTHIKQVLRNRDYPLAELARDLNGADQSGKVKLCNTTFAWENVNSFEKGSPPIVSWPSLTERNWDMGELGLWRRHLRKTQIDEFDITFKLYNFNDKLYGGIEYNAALFTLETINNIRDGFNALLKNVVNKPETDIHKLAILPIEKCQQQLFDWNNTEIPYDKEKTLHKKIEYFADKFPEAPALSFGNTVLSYKLLNEQANRLAHYLIGKGVKAGILVGISLPRSLEMYVAVLAVLKAGGAYVPLDPSYPHVRLQHIVDDSGIKLCLTESALVSQTPQCEQALFLDFISDQINTMPSGNPTIDILPDQLAYVIYTSGSTGKPKGVMIQHRGLAHLMITHREAYGLNGNDRVLQFASLSFDASISAMALAWQCGSTLVAVQQEELIGQALFNTINVQHISAAILPPSLLIGQERFFEKIATLKTLIVAGEVCSQELAKCWSKGRRFFNAYGPTESTVWATGAEVNGSDVPVIGRPIANTQVYILDKYHNPVPVGIAGELYIGGDGLARGYLNRPELTAERFIPNPLPGTPGDRLYKSGDLARYRPDGQIEFLGRIDHQVKIRGYRIELGEIEATCLADVSIKEALVTTFDQAGSPQLVAYVVPHIIEQFNADALKDSLRKTLPDYMIPAFVVALDKFPLTPNDKIDRRVLPEPLADIVEETHSLPCNTIEQAIAKVWSEVLGIEPIPLNKNFFDLGGHSLKVVEVYDKLPDNLREQLVLVDLYEYTTVAALAKKIVDESTSEPQASKPDVTQEIRISNTGESQDVAIISAAVRVPGAETPEQFWRNLCEGEEGISFFNDEQLLEAGVEADFLKKSYYVKAKGVVDNIRTFDADFFNMTPREAQITDPQQRHFLECAWEALERAGYVGELDGGSIGVYAGVGQNRYYMHHIASHPDLEKAIGEMPISLGNNRDFIATRVAYKLHLRGPAVAIQTACSTSLVAVHTAVQALLRGECDMALAGGVSLGNLMHKGYLHTEGMIGSPDGHTRTFDEKAAGTVASQGTGLVLLKPLAQARADNDPIIAVIKGSAINNDGANKAGFTAPSVIGQSEVISQTLQRAGVSAESIGYVEAHGTATHVGDPIEVTGLTQAYRKDTDRKQYCALGSLKSNLGHLDTAAGVAGLIKAAMVVQHGQIPPTLHFRSPNPEIDFASSPFFVNDSLIAFPHSEHPRRAAVSAFGLGGTNAHAILETYCDENVSDETLPVECEPQLLVLSARTLEALLDSANNLSRHITENPQQSLKNIAYTLRIGRKVFSHRISLLVDNHKDAVQQLQALTVDDLSVADEEKQPVFLFPGQGVHYSEMGAFLYQNDASFRADMDFARDILKSIAKKRDIHFSDADLRGETERLQQVELAPALVFILEYCVALSLIRAGIAPAAMMGHSAGEYVAATLAGVFTLEQGVELMLTRCQLMQSVPEGRMLALPMSAEKASRWLEPFSQLTLAARNAAEQCVVSGPIEQIELLEKRLGEERISCRRLQVERACHSSMLDPILPSFREQLQTFQLKKPAERFISSLTGNWITDQQAVDPEYWVSHLRQPVNYARGVTTLLQSGYRDFIEVGPGSVLTALTRRCVVDKEVEITVEATLDRHQYDSEAEAWWSGLGALWSRGYPLSWSSVEASTAKRVVLPTYPFQRQEHWIEPKRAYVELKVMSADGVHKKYNRRVTDTTTYSRRSTDSVKFERREADRLPIFQRRTSDTQSSAEAQIELPLAELPAAQLASTQPILQKVKAVWQVALGVIVIKPRDNFFKLGGDSLLALRALNQLSEHYDIKLRPPSMLEHPTAKGLADYIQMQLEQLKQNASAIDGGEMEKEAVPAPRAAKGPPALAQGSSQPPGNVVRLREGEEGNVILVLVHPVGGEVYYYQDLCNNLPESLPIYAIQSPGLEEGGSAYDDVVEMATAYLAELEQRLVSKQNIILGGSSFGGLVALEIASQFEAKYDMKLPLVMIDTPTPDAIRPYSMFRSADVFDYLLRNALGGKVKVDIEALAKLDLDKQIQHVSKASAKVGIELPPHFTRNMIDTWLVHQQALVDYQVPEYEGPVLYLRHGETLENFPKMLHRDWLHYLLGDFTVKRVEGHHISMNFGENAEQLGRAIYAFIEQVTVDLVLERVKRNPIFSLVV